MKQSVVKLLRWLNRTIERLEQTQFVGKIIWLIREVTGKLLGWINRTVERLEQTQFVGKIIWLITEVTGKLRYVLLAYLLSRGLAIVIFSIIEGWHPLEAHWWSGVSALTIGYGDFFPKTVHGRLIADVFQHFWIFYCAPAIAAHVLIKLFKNLSAFTHREQEWLFWVIGLLFKRQMWQIRATLLIAQHMGIADQLPPVPGRDMDGSFLDLPRQPHDFDDIDEEFSLPPHEPDEHVHESA